MARPSTTPNVRSISGLRNVRHRGGRWTRAERLSDANEPPFQIDRTKIVVVGSWKAPPGDGAFWSFIGLSSAFGPRPCLISKLRAEAVSSQLLGAFTSKTTARSNRRPCSYRCQR